ncbi:MAG: spore cortex biosynthesis protein YabQ [Clostridia bacterium]|nr:spore cortex biosynthesis protein YabQ [Clostridia bacterium]
MNAWTQLGEFSVSAMVGLALAGALDLFAVRKRAGKGRLFGAALEVFLFALFAGAFVLLSTRLGFSGVRGYQYLGVALGMILYLKTFRIIVAFFKKVCYNTGKKVLEKTKRKQKTLKNEEK